MVFKNELYPIHFYGRVRGKCDGRLQNWPGIANERPKILAMSGECSSELLTFAFSASSRHHLGQQNGHGQELGMEEVPL